MAAKRANCRQCRREGVKLYLKAKRCYTPKCPIERKGAVPPGQHGPKGQRRRSDYGLQLREKQKVKRLYGLRERQLRRYFAKAAKQKGATGRVLLRLLETRLDNVIYRLGLASSRSVARQLVSHQHVLVNDKKVNIASYQVKAGEVISLAIKALVDKSQKVPAWLSRKAGVGQVNRFPEREELETEIDESLIVEFYSR